MGAPSAVRRVGGSVRQRARRWLAPNYEELVGDRDHLMVEMHRAFESLSHAHAAIADLQAEIAALRTDADRWRAEEAERLDLLDDGMHEARRLNLRIAELTDLVTELVLPLHDREIDPARLAALRPDTV